VTKVREKSCKTIIVMLYFQFAIMPLRIFQFSDVFYTPLRIIAPNRS